MSPKVIIYICLSIGSVAGGFIPTLWGAGFLSFSSLVFSAFGGVIGIFVGMRIIRD